MQTSKEIVENIRAMTKPQIDVLTAALEMAVYAISGFTVHYHLKSPSGKQRAWAIRELRRRSPKQKSPPPD